MPLFPGALGVDNEQGIALVVGERGDESAIPGWISRALRCSHKAIRDFLRPSQLSNPSSWAIAERGRFPSRRPQMVRSIASIWTPHLVARDVWLRPLRSNSETILIAV